MRVRTSLVTLSLLVILIAGHAHAEDPAYMSLEVGDAVEVSGDWVGEDSIFAAEEIELLPAPRRPKLRGAIQATDSVSQRIMLFGQWITVTDQTQFLNVEDIPLGFSILTPKARLEASCKVDSTGQWVARHIRVRGVKDSDKIKGTITLTDFDGKAPEHLEIEGLRVLVDDETVLFKTLGTMTEEDDESDAD